MQPPAPMAGSDIMFTVPTPRREKGDIDREIAEREDVLRRRFKALLGVPFVLDVVISCTVHNIDDGGTGSRMKPDRSCVPSYGKLSRAQLEELHEHADRLDWLYTELGLNLSGMRYTVLSRDIRRCASSSM